MRTHLLDCQACRESVQEGKVLRRWFEGDGEESVVPEGFAARVARRAFAGDPGVLTPTGTTPPLIVERTSEPTVRSTPILPFVLKLTAAAAGLVFVLSLFIKDANLPTGSEIGADVRPFWEKEEALGDRAQQIDEDEQEAESDEDETNR